MRQHLEEIIHPAESTLADDAESLIADARYAWITEAVKGCVRKDRARLTASDQIDRIVTNRILALPIFAAVMVLVYVIAVTSLGCDRGHLTRRGLNRLYQRRPDWGMDPTRRAGTSGACRRRRLADRIDCGWYRRRRWFGHRICTADAGTVPARRLRLYGARRIHHGPHFPPLWPVREVLYPHANRNGLRCARGDGIPHNRTGPRPKDDHHNHDLYPLWRENAHRCSAGRRSLRRRLVGCPLSILHWHLGGDPVRHPAQKNRMFVGEPAPFVMELPTCQRQATYCAPPGNAAAPSFRKQARSSRWPQFWYGSAAPLA